MAAEKSAPTTSPDLAAVDQAIGDLVAKGMKALAEYASYDQAQIDHIVAKAAVAALDQHGDLADLAVKETGLVLKQAAAGLLHREVCEVTVLI